MSYCFEHKTYKCEFESGSENKKSELLALAPTLTLFVAPSGLPESLRSPGQASRPSVTKKSRLWRDFCCSVRART